MYNRIKRRLVKELRRLRVKFMGRGHIVKRKQSSLRYPFFLREGTDDEFIERDVFRENQSYSPSDFGENPKWIIDAGANIGLRTIWFANMFPESKIISIEPDAENFALLTKNAAPYPNVRCVNAGLWKNDAALRVENHQKGPLAIMVKELTPDTASESDLHGVTVSSLMREYDIPSIDVLKIDIEGSEIEVFEHSEEWIDKIDVFLIELHDRLRRGCCKTFFNAIERFDYVVEFEYYGDNLLVKIIR